jgi:prophage regulatory protein
MFITSNPGNASSATITKSVFMRLTSVMLATGLARSTIYKLIAARQFPAQVRLTGRAVGWRRTDVESWTEARQAATH